MTTLVNLVVDNYHALFWDHRDPRVDGWLMMSSPFPTLAICLLYVYFVKVAGPQLMSNRKPYEFRNLLVAYNAFQVVFSAWIFYELGMSGWFGKYSFTCEPIDYSNDPMAVRFGMGGWFRGYSFRCQPVDYTNSEIGVRMVYASWWYYFSKFTEFFDTFSFIFRKKYEHVSTLHVIHHGIMPMSVWFGVKFTPGGHSTFFGLLNSFVHIVMYFYYMLAAMGPQYYKYLWWKRHLTTLQMIQFIGIFTHAFQLSFTECDYPRAFMWWIGGHAVLFFFLFSEFYRDAYLKRRSAAAAAASSKKQASLGITSIIPCMIHDTDSLSNGVTKLPDKLSNGYAKGHANGYANGHVNGYANGHANGYANGHANGYANGHANGHVIGANNNITPIGTEESPNTSATRRKNNKND